MKFVLWNFSFSLFCCFVVFLIKFLFPEEEKIPIVLTPADLWYLSWFPRYCHGILSTMFNHPSVSTCFNLFFFIHFYLLFLSILSNSANYDHHISVFHTSHQGVNLLFQRPTSWWVSNPGRRPLLPGCLFFFTIFYVFFTGLVALLPQKLRKVSQDCNGVGKEWSGSPTVSCKRVGQPD